MAKLALLGGEPQVGDLFPQWPQSTELEARLLMETLDSGNWWRMSGTQVRRFETDFGKLHNRAYGLAVTNGTHALELALRTLGIGPGDEVIIPSMTYIATASAVVIVGARPIAVDVLPHTWCLDVEAVRLAITPRTKAVIPVHFAGHIADMDNLLELCNSHNIGIVEDAAHAHGARWNGRPAGSFGQIATFSFQNYKILTAGEGGMLLMADEETYNMANLIANCGRAPNDTSYEHSVLGSNYRTSEFQAAVLNGQLARLPELAERREQVAWGLDDLMTGVDGVEPQGYCPEVDRHARYMYVFTYNPAEFGGVPRDLFVKALVAEGIPAYRMYPRVQDTTFYKTELEKQGSDLSTMPACSVSKHLASSGVWIHHRALLEDVETAAQIVHSIEKVRSSADELFSSGMELSYD